ncbi:MAG: glycosyltransferase [Bacteroidaceae bacterium]|nr:glycosyltransferase [Bacteroidaceae bacterium]
MNNDLSPSLFKDEVILSLCLPTYNRAQCLRQQFLRMLSLPDDVLGQIEIIVSDNCSTDDTEAVVQQFKDRISFQYLRNETNVGPDANFLQCLNRSRGKYVWLLGDDDPLQVTHLPELLRMLRDEEWGLVHVCRYGSRQTRHVYQDAQQFLCEVGVMITFMSANIFRRESALTLDLEKYLGTNLLQVPMYLAAALSGRPSMLYHHRLFDSGTAIATNGGYNLLRVFVQNLSQMLDEFEEGVSPSRADGAKYYLSPHTVMTIKNRASDFMFPFIFNYLLLHKRSNFDTKGGWTLVHEHLGYQRVTLSGLKFCCNPVQLRNISGHLFSKLKRRVVPLLARLSLWIWPRGMARLMRNVHNAFVSWRFALSTPLRHQCYIQKPLYYSGAKYMHIGKRFCSAPDLRIECIPTGVSEPRLTIGDDVNINFRVHIGCINSITIGNRVLMGSNVLITDHSHGRTNRLQLDLPPNERPLVSKGPITIEDDVWICENVCILPGVHIGRGAVIGAGAVVTRDVPAYAVAMGNPAVVR